MSRRKGPWRRHGRGPARRLRDVPILPTLVTLGNTFCGFLAIAYVADSLAASPDAVSAGGKVLLRENRLVWACWLIFIAMIFDALDGRIARMTKQTSPFGAELDSLSDVVTFGVAPAFLAKIFLQHYVFGPTAMHPRLSLLLGVLFASCAALRLARYNTEKGHDEEDGVDKFQGLPSPAAAGAVASVVLLYFHIDKARPVAMALPAVVLLAAILMVSRVPFPHVVNTLLKGRRPFTTLAQSIVLLVLASFFLTPVVAVVFVGYLFFGLGAHCVALVRERRRSGAGAGAAAIAPADAAPPAGPGRGVE